MVVLTTSEAEAKAIEGILPLFKYISITYSVMGMMELGYHHPASFPSSGEWVWTGEVDADYFDDPMGAKGGGGGGDPIPGPLGPPSPVHALPVQYCRVHRVRVHQVLLLLRCPVQLLF